MLSTVHLRHASFTRPRTSHGRCLMQTASIVIGQDDNNNDVGGDSSVTSTWATASMPIDINNLDGRRRYHSTSAIASVSTLIQRNQSIPLPSYCHQHYHHSPCTPSSSSGITINHNIPIRYTSSSPSPLPPPSSSITDQLTSILSLPPTPDFLTNATFWGATGILLTNFHTHLHLPYWACISLTNVCIRSAMIPIAIQGAKTSVKFGAISPEVQFMITSFTNDMKQLKMKAQWSKEGSFTAQQSVRGQMQLVKATMQTLRGLFTMNKVNLLDIFKSPTLQIPIFWYFAVDLRKIIEGSDPALAQQMVESSFFYLTDLTEPDPWYGLPIATGLLLYLNVEMAVGKKSLSGETSSKSNIASFLKDAFQTLAVFMPCFMAQQPAGVQLYLATSMVFTLLQSKAMRTDSIRQAVGLPPIGAKPEGQGQFMKDFMEKMAERQAIKARGGFVLGEGVSIRGVQVTIPRSGKKRKSSIVVEKEKTVDNIMDKSKMTKIEFEITDYSLKTGLLVIPDYFKQSTPIPYMPGMADPVFHTATGMAPIKVEEQALTMPDIPLSAMEAANRGEKPIEMAPREVLAKRVESKAKSSGPIDSQKLKSKWNKKKGRRGKK